MYPINIQDFLFKDGVRVLSAYEVLAMKRNYKPLQNLKLSPYISMFGLNDCNDITNEMVFTNQEGKIYYVTSFNYFVDLADLEIEFSVR